MKMASGLSSILPLLLFCFAFATDVDENLCKTRVEEFTLCFDKFDSGIKCHGEGNAATNCFKRCLNISRLYGDFYTPMKSLEEVICEAQLEKEIPKGRCLEIMFKHCNDAYNYNWVVAEYCRIGAEHFEACEKTAILWMTTIPNSKLEDCTRFMDKVHDVYRARCPHKLPVRVSKGGVSTIPGIWVVTATLTVLMSTKIIF